jgi:hypothetical protein
MLFCISGFSMDSREFNTLSHYTRQDFTVHGSLCLCPTKLLHNFYMFLLDLKNYACDCRVFLTQFQVLISVIKLGNMLKQVHSI